jgi:hypothetical protein
VKAVLRDILRIRKKIPHADFHYPLMGFGDSSSLTSHVGELPPSRAAAQDDSADGSEFDSPDEISTRLVAADVAGPSAS